MSVKNTETFVYIHIDKSGGHSIYTYLRNSRLFGEKSPLFLKYIHRFNPTCELKDTYDKKILLFIRDPVSRFISCFNYIKHSLNHPVKKHYMKTHGILYENKYPDLNDILLKPRTTKIKNIFDFTKKLNHLNTSISDYLTDYSNDQEDYLNKINHNILFCGRFEYLQEDFEKMILLIEKSTGNIRPDKAALQFLHKSKKDGKFLTKKSIELIRNYYSNDYNYIQKLIDLGHLDKNYITEILNTEKYEY